MNKILVIQHVAHEPLGVLDPMLREAQFNIEYVNFSLQPKLELDIQAYAALIVLGGPMNVDEHEKYPYLLSEVDFIKQAINEDIPILGICLGAQLIATALEAKVYLANDLEVGWYALQRNETGTRDVLIQHFNPEENIFQWHGRTYDTPQGAINLISSDICPNQAFRYGNKVYGFQFHLEVDEAVIERWMHLPSHAEDLQRRTKHLSLVEEKEQTQKFLPRSKQLAKNVFSEFIKLLPQNENKAQQRAQR